MNTNPQENDENGDDVASEAAAEAPVEQSVSETEDETPVAEEASTEETVPEKKSNPKARWYVLHVYSGFENKVADAIHEKARKKGLSDHVEEILVPTEEVVEVKRGQRVNTERKFFPGYVLAKLDLNDDVWHLIKDTPKVTGFLGGGNKPVPISQKEADSLIKQIQEGVDRPRPSVVYDIGEEVKVIDGPFASFNGIVEDLDEEKAKLKVSVSIFGRATPVELEYSQVEKI